MEELNKHGLSRQPQALNLAERSSFMRVPTGVPQDVSKARYRRRTPNRAKSTNDIKEDIAP
jgi:hypothetical protein